MPDLPGFPMRRKIQFALFLCVFSLGVIIAMCKAGWQIARSEDVAFWPTARGVVIDTGIRYDAAVFGDDFVPVVRFRYQVTGTSYESSRIWRYPTGVQKARARQIARRYAPGARVVVYYDPATPATGVLRSGLYSDASRMQMLLFGAIILAGIWVLAWRIGAGAKDPDRISG